MLLIREDSSQNVAAETNNRAEARADQSDGIHGTNQKNATWPSTSKEVA